MNETENMLLELRDKKKSCENDNINIKCRLKENEVKTIEYDKLIKHLSNLLETNRECENCNKGFYSTGNLDIFCSKECEKEWLKREKMSEMNYEGQPRGEEE